MGYNLEKLRFVFEIIAFRSQMRKHFVLRIITGIKNYLSEIFFYLSEIKIYLSEKIIYPTEFLFLSNQFSNFPKTKRCAHEYNDYANQPIKPITITDHENQEQHQEQNQKLKNTESETKSG